MEPKGTLTPAGVQPRGPPSGTPGLLLHTAGACVHVHLPAKSIRSLCWEAVEAKTRARDQLGAVPGKT